MKKTYTLFLILIVLCIQGCHSGISRRIVLHPKKTGIATHRYFDQARGRPLITEVWYPIDEQTPAQEVAGLWVRCAEARNALLKPSSSKYPLIVMSHGNGGDR